MIQDHEKETVRTASGTLRWTQGTDIRGRKGHLLDIHGRLARLRGHWQEQSQFAPDRGYQGANHVCVQEWCCGGDRAQQFVSWRAPTDTRGKACRTGWMPPDHQADAALQAVSDDAIQAAG